MDQNQVTKHFSVGNTLRQETVARCHELGLWLNPDAIKNK